MRRSTGTRRVNGRAKRKRPRLDSGPMRADKGDSAEAAQAVPGAPSPSAIQRDFASRAVPDPHRVVAAREHLLRHGPGSTPAFGEDFLHLLLRGVLFPQGKRRQFMATYAAWLRPHKAHVVLVFALALVTAGLQMVEPLFMRFIVDDVLLTSLSLEERLTRLHVAGALFVAVVRAPLTGIALVVEMTGATSLFVPLLTACASAVAVPAMLGSRPIYDTLQERDAARRRLAAKP